MAAIELRDRDAQDSDRSWVSMGLHVGRVIEGPFQGDDIGVTAAGDPLDVAVELQRAAPKGTILLTRTLAERVRTDVHTRVSEAAPDGVNKDPPSLVHWCSRA